MEQSQIATLDHFLHFCLKIATQRYILDATRRYSTLLDATRRYSTLLDATRRYSTLLDATRRYSSLDATRRYSTPRYSTLIDATRHYCFYSFNFLKNNYLYLAPKAFSIRRSAGLRGESNFYIDLGSPFRSLKKLLNEAFWRLWSHSVERF
jgi:hypothetical protein